MKRKIAICASGWSNEYLKTVVSGIRKCAAENNADVFLLVNYIAANEEQYKENAEKNIFHLLNYGSFDGVIILSNTLHIQSEYDYLQQVIRERSLPAICLEYPMQGIDYIGTDNYSGMYELSEHLVHAHGVERVVYVSGPSDNDENNLRRKALEDVLHAHSLTLRSEDVIVCNWNFFEVLDSLPVWLKEHTLPDAFVCANDVMAMAVCSVLDMQKIRVPEDVIVSGFDCLESALLYSPVIATVDRGWDNMGYCAMQELLDKIAGKQIVKVRMVNSKAAPAESCGCSLTEELLMKRPPKNGLYNTMVSNAYWGGHLCDISEKVGKAISREELHKTFSEFLQTEHRYEGDELYICLVDNFFSSLISEEDSLQALGYTKQMNVIVSLKDGRAKEQYSFPIGELIPNYDESAPGGRLFFFAPFYNVEGCYGYVAFGNELPMLYDYSLYNWMRNLTECFGHVRQNIVLAEMNRKLEVLSLTDGLTGVYNRMGCEKRAYPYLEQCYHEGKRAVMMFADINKMKGINDKYGHLQGDLAITTVARSVREVLGEKWIIVRYGGDEFLMVGECEQEEQANTYLKAILERLQENAVQLKLPYRLEIGVGFEFVEPQEKLDLSECLRRADEAMYRRKRSRHIGRE